MRNKIFGGIGILWGGAILFNWLFSSSQASGNNAYQSGQSFAVIFGSLLFIVGLYTFFKKTD
ncbi:MAG: hypothetical protein ACC657_18035 [Thiohalomonadales bacterium]